MRFWCSVSEGAGPQVLSLPVPGLGPGCVASSQGSANHLFPQQGSGVRQLRAQPLGPSTEPGLLADDGVWAAGLDGLLRVYPRGWTQPHPCEARDLFLHCLAPSALDVAPDPCHIPLATLSPTPTKCEVKYIPVQGKEKQNRPLEQKSTLRSVRTDRRVPQRAPPKRGAQRKIGAEKPGKRTHSKEESINKL